MLFNYLYFDPKNTDSPITIKDGKLLIESDEMLEKIKSSFFKKFTNNPFFYFSGTHDIPQLDDFINYGRYNDILKNQNVDFFFFEPLTHYLPTLLLNYRPHILKSNNSLYDRENIRCYELDNISAWVEKNDVKNITVYCTDYKSNEYYKNVYPNLTLKFMDVFAASVFSNYSRVIKKYRIVEDLSPMHIEKKLIAPAWRYDPSRHFIMSFLAEKNLIEHNNISFLYSVDEKEMIKSLWFNLNEFKFKHPEFAKILIDGNEKLKNLVPLTINVHNPLKIYGASGRSPQGTNVVKSHNFINAYKSAFLALVMESRVTQPWPNISEKTINAITSERPFVLAGAPGVLKFLRELGFKTFSDFWDESYDDIELHDDRLVKVCSTVESICSMSIEQMRDMHTRMSPILKHNREHIKNIDGIFKKYL